MCRVYRNKKGAYVRTCYRTGQAGRHVPLASVKWTPGGHVSRDALALIRDRAKE